MAISLFRGASLSRKNEEFLAHIWNELREPGASDQDIGDSTPGLTDAIFANSRTQVLGNILHMVALVVVTVILCAPILLLNNSSIAGTKFINTNSKNWILHLIQLWLLSILICTSWRHMLLPLLWKRSIIVQAHTEIFYAVSAIGYVVYVLYLMWKDRFVYISQNVSMGLGDNCPFCWLDIIIYEYRSDPVAFTISKSTCIFTS
jgi:hypothetical protein